MENKMNLEEFIKQVEICLVEKCYVTIVEVRDLISEYLADIEWYYNKGLIPLGVANILKNPLY